MPRPSETILELHCALGVTIGQFELIEAELSSIQQGE
jgi:hypothetical protein